MQDLLIFWTAGNTSTLTMFAPKADKTPMLDSNHAAETRDFH
jgi:hypothetical protein